MVSIKYELLILLGGLTTIIKPEFLAASSITSSKTCCERNQSDRMPRPQHVQFPRSQCYSKGRRWIDIDFLGSYFFLNITLKWMILTILTNMKRKHVHVCNIIDRNTISVWCQNLNEKEIFCSCFQKYLIICLPQTGTL